MRAASSLLVVECLLYDKGQTIIISKLASTTNIRIQMHFFAICVHMKILICAGAGKYFFTRHALRPAYLPIERILGNFNLGQSGCDVNQNMSSPFPFTFLGYGCLFPRNHRLVLKFIPSLLSLSCYRSIASSKACSPHSAVLCFLS